MRSIRFWLMTTILAASFLPVQTAQTNGGEAYIYKDALAAGWYEWLWDTLTVDYNITSSKYAGEKSMAIMPGRGWMAWSAFNDSGLDNIATAKTRIPKLTAAVTANTVKTTLAPYSLTAIVLQSNAEDNSITPTSQRNKRFHGR